MRFNKINKIYLEENLQPVVLLIFYDKKLKYFLTLLYFDTSKSSLKYAWELVVIIIFYF